MLLPYDASLLVAFDATGALILVPTFGASGLAVSSAWLSLAASMGGLVGWIAPPSSAGPWVLAARRACRRAWPLLAASVGGLTRRIAPLCSVVPVPGSCRPGVRAVVVVFHPRTVSGSVVFLSRLSSGAASGHVPVLSAGSISSSILFLVCALLLPKFLLVVCN